MLAAKEVVPPAEATDAPGWHVKRRAIEHGVKRSLLHLRCWRRLVVPCSDPNPTPNLNPDINPNSNPVPNPYPNPHQVSCSDAAQLANQETQRARAVLAVRVDLVRVRGNPNPNYANPNPNYANPNPTLT